MLQSRPGRIAPALLAGAVAIVAAWLDLRYRWITPAFDWVAHQFYEVPLLARYRRPSQLILVRWHLTIGSTMLVAGLMAAPWLTRHARAWLTIFAVGYAIRAIVWICGGNLPLVPGDSCHYLEVFDLGAPRRGAGQALCRELLHELSPNPRRPGRARRLGHTAGRLRAGLRDADRRSGTGGSSGIADRRREGMQLPHQPALSPGALRLRPASVRPPHGDRRHGRAGDPAGPCDLRGLRAPREPGRPDLDPGDLVADRGLAFRAALPTRLDLGGGGRPLRRPGDPGADDVAGAPRRRRPVLPDRPQTSPVRPSAPLGPRHGPGHTPLGAGDLPGIRQSVPLLHILLRIQLLVDHPPLREGQHATFAVLHRGQPAGDRPREGQVAADHRGVFDDDRGPADRRGIPRPAEIARRAGTRRSTSWSRRSSWSSCWRRSRVSPT